MQRTSFPWWTILGAVVFGVVMFLGVLAVVLSVLPAPPPPGTREALVTIIAAPSLTAPGATGQPPDAPTMTPPPPPPPGSITVGSLVQIAGTGGDGLRLRTAPGLEEEVRFLGLEAEVFEVIEGPVEADGFTWFLLMAPIEETRQGWAVSSYLAAVQNP